MQALVRGGVYLVKDESLRLIPEENRIVHDSRWPVLLVTGSIANTRDEWPFALVCPISGSTGKRTVFDVQLSAGQGGVTKKCWIRIPAVQPLMKSNLQDRNGILDERVLSQVDVRLAQYLGLIEV